MAKASSAREDMLSAAVDLFAARGFEGVGIAELLTKSGAPRGSLYFHFPGGKEQIGAEVVARVGAEVAARFRGLHDSGVDMATFIDRVFTTTAKECKDRQYKASCPMAAIATGFGIDNPKLAAAVRTAFNSWEDEIRLAAEARGMNAVNAASFASAMLAAMEGAFVISKAQESDKAHVNASRALQVFAASLIAN
ncbi:MAG: TetR/AcrR family transcriptional regulator [Phycisphaerales bacterium]|nr:TetR/AcrR family transcriptional regulator [Hyphomonadaceae bacterium]